MAARIHSEKLICRYLHQLASFDDQNVQYGFFRVLNRLEGVLKWPEIRIMQYSKWPPFCFIKFYFLFTSWFILDTGSSLWARIGPRAPSLLSMRCTMLIRGRLWMILPMLPEKNGAWYGFRPFFKIACHNENLIWIISPVLIYIES